MRFSNTFKIIWWFMVVGPLTAILSFRIPSFVSGRATPIDFGMMFIWSLLFVAPIYVEISVGGVTLKQQIDTVREEVKSEVASIRNELHMIGVNTHVSPQFTVTTPPANADLPAIEQRVKAAVAEVLATYHLPEPQPVQPESIGAPPDVSFLFGVRYQIDHELARIANEQGLDLPVRKRYGLGLAREMAVLGIIDQRLVGAIHEIYRVCSPAIHGETPNDKQVAFVRDVGPNVLAALRSIKLSALDRAFDEVRMNAANPAHNIPVRP
jgi:hypothetical protein